MENKMRNLGIATLRYTRNIDGFFETVEETRHGLTEAWALKDIYGALELLIENNKITMDNVLWIKTEGFE